jgi:hypothetical protein
MKMTIFWDVVPCSLHTGKYEEGLLHTHHHENLKPHLVLYVLDENNEHANENRVLCFLAPIFL